VASLSSRSATSGSDISGGERAYALSAQDDTPHYRLSGDEFERLSHAKFEREYNDAREHIMRSHRREPKERESHRSGTGVVVSVVPEPSGALLLGAGLAVLAWSRPRRHRAR
jgi:hypothetical protein